MIFVYVIVGVCLIPIIHLLGTILLFVVPRGKLFAQAGKNTPVSGVDDEIKRPFLRRLVPDNIDTIIVGSGIAGLTTGVLLSKAGKRVLVLEKHKRAGGSTHTFHKDGFEFNTGVHYVNSMSKTDLDRVVLDDLTGDRIDWVKFPDTFDHVHIGKEVFHISEGHSNFKKMLYSRFPKEKQGIDTFMTLMSKCRSAAVPFFYFKIFDNILSAPGRWLLPLLRFFFLRKWDYYVHKTTREVVESLTDDPVLQSLLTYVRGDIAMQPSEMPFIWTALIMDNFVGNGVYYPVGGPSVIAKNMVATIRQFEGEVLTSANVTEILIENNRAVGVRLKHGGDVFASNVVSACNASTLIHTLLPESVLERTHLKDQLETLTPGSGHLTCFLGLDGAPEDMGIPQHNHWLFSSTDMCDVENVLKSHPELPSDPSLIARQLLISFPSTKDKTKDQHQVSVLMLADAPYEWFKKWSNSVHGKRDDEYEEAKEFVGDAMRERFLALYPQCRDRILFTLAGTPLSSCHYLNVTHGQSVGIAATAERLGARWLKAVSPIDHLFLTGQDSFIPGVTPAMHSGVITASVMLGHLAYGYMPGMANVKYLKEVDEH